MKVAAVLFSIAAVAGLLAPNPQMNTPPRLGPYRVLAGDFHLHMFPLDDSSLAPWDVVLEARRRGLDVIALTGHNQVWTAKAGRWFARLAGRPLVLVGEEIMGEAQGGAPYHLIAVGIEHTVDWHGTAAESIAAIHRQGGVAIAAHPLRRFWPAYDDAAMRELDGAEVLHPMAFAGPEYEAELRGFYERRPLAAIGSSDFHGTSHPGVSRTYVFVRDDAGRQGAGKQGLDERAVTAQDILQALRERQTVAVERDGRAYGDPELIRLAEAHGGLPPSGVEEAAGAWSQLSRAAAVAGMLVAAFLGGAAAKRPAPAAGRA